jgi:hypothetical protein
MCHANFASLPRTLHDTIISCLLNEYELSYICNICNYVSVFCLQLCTEWWGVSHDIKRHSIIEEDHRHSRRCPARRPYNRIRARVLLSPWPRSWWMAVQSNAKTIGLVAIAPLCEL